ncbi:hypothetical protein ACEPAF_6187 [Sanghuangporus sanghuang]
MPAVQLGSQVHPRVLTILEQCMRRLVEDEGEIETNSTRLWPEDMCFTSQNCGESSLQEIRSRIDDIQTLKDVEKGLKLLTENLKAAITNSCAAILPATRQFGFALLPDEVILLVLKQLFDSYKDPFFGAHEIIRTLSLVSVRFREMVLVCTELWAYLDLDRCHADAVDLFINRSNGKPLFVTFRASPSKEQAILRALKHRDRWHYLNVTFSDSFDASPFKLPALAFPAAKTLILDIDIEDVIPGILPIWIFPKARSLEVVTSFPPQHMFCYESLKSFSYKTYEQAFFDSSAVFMEKLTDFLRPAISLFALHLDVSYVDDFGGFGSELQVELPTVQIFSITNWIWGPESEFIEAFESDPMHEDNLARIIRTMKIPNARDISVSMLFVQKSSEDVFILSEWLSAAFPKSHGMRSVSNVTFKILDPPVARLSERAVVQINGLFEHFQALQSLSLGTGHCNVMLTDSDALEAGLENLRSFQIKFNGEYRASFLDALYLMGDYCKILEEVEVQSRLNFEPRTFETIFPGVKVHRKRG